MVMNQMRPHLTVVLTLFTAFACAAQETGAPAGPGYHLLEQIPIGGEGGSDNLTLDPKTRRLYVPHESKIVVVDIDQNQIAGEITNTPGVHTFLPVDEYGVGFSTDGGEDRLALIKLKTLKTRSKIKAGLDPDTIVHDSGSDLIYVFNRGDNSVSLFESDDGDAVSTTPLPGKPAGAAVDPLAGHVFCNLEGTNAVAVIDAVSHQVVNVWPIGSGENPSGMALDISHHRLFLVCQGNNRLVMMDSVNGRVIDSAPIGKGGEAVAFDPATQLVFSANGEGNVTIVHEDSPDKLTVMQILATAVGTRALALDPKTHDLYVAAAEYNPSAQPVSGGQSPAMIPGSFKILVYGK